MADRLGNGAGLSEDGEEGDEGMTFWFCVNGWDVLLAVSVL